MPIKKNREYRDMEIRISETADMFVVGYASTFDQPYILYEDDDVVLREVVDRSAFDNADMSDVIMQYNHEGRVFARISNGTLEVSPDDVGLHIIADLSGTEIGRNLYEEIKGGYTNKMSFGFTIDEDEWDERDENGKRVSTRIIKSVKRLYDVSAVSIPANDATTISVRGLVDGVINRLQTERSEKEHFEFRKRKLEMIARRSL